ncbi:MAG: RidA family protein [Treponema sp.]|jgi:2-iminobutanoate/2-iminopropanoate deaminase|nr:RidA family protein [Treponema sp.]
MKTVSTEKAPAAIGPYSQCCVSGTLVFTSGQLPLSPETGGLVGETITEQTEQTIKNLKAVLEASGSSLERVVKTLCFLKDMKDFPAFNEVYAKHFPGRPARSTAAVKELAKNALVEIEAVAETGETK